MSKFIFIGSPPRWYILVCKIRESWRIREGGGGGGGKKKTISFSPVTFKNVEISPQNFLTFSFKPFVTLCKISRPYLAPDSNY